MKNLTNSKYTLLIAMFIVLFLSSCSSKYLTLSTGYSDSMPLSDNNSTFAFVTINKLYKMPIGIAKFPDGGTTTKVYYDVALYYYDIAKGKLNRIVDLNDIRALYPKDIDYVSIKLALNNSIIYYKINEPRQREIEYSKKYARSEEEKLKLDKAIKYVSKIHAYNIKTKESLVVKSLPSNVEWYKKNYKQRKLLKSNYLTKLSYSDWNIILKDIYPQSQKTYMQYIIQKEQGHILEAVYEQIVPSFDKEDIDYILAEMDDRKKELYDEYKNNSDGVYQESLKRDKYNKYVEYIEKTRNKLITMGMLN